MNHQLSGRTALITGSSKGLGLVLARGLAHAGAHVILNARGMETLESARSALSAEGLSVSSLAFDATDEAAVEHAVAALELDGRSPDILVNNAGMQHRVTLEEFPTEAWDAILRVNLTAPFLVSRAVARGMIRRGGGKIINIGSLQSRFGRRTIAPYAASKGGLAMLTRGMCVDWARYNIQVNSIAPGYFATEMTKALRDDEVFDTWLKARTPAGRWGDPEELVGAAVLFASPGSDFINGQILYIDGGISASI